MGDRCGRCGRILPTVWNEIGSVCLGHEDEDRIAALEAQLREREEEASGFDSEIKRLAAERDADGIRAEFAEFAFAAAREENERLKMLDELRIRRMEATETGSVFEFTDPSGAVEILVSGLAAMFDLHHPPNYLVFEAVTRSTEKNPQRRFEVTIRDKAKGKTDHEKRLEAESELAALRADDPGRVERVARELSAQHPVGGGSWEWRTDQEREKFRRDARAVLAAADGKGEAK